MNRFQMCLCGWCLFSYGCTGTNSGQSIGPISEQVFSLNSCDIPSTTQVDVASRSSGDGTPTNPWIGWDSGPWQCATTYIFKSGVYAFSTPPTWSSNGALQNIQILGKEGAILWYQGSGPDAIVFDGTNYTNGATGIRLENITLTGCLPGIGCGGSALANGIHLIHVARSTFRNLRIDNIGQVGLIAEGVVVTTFDDLRISPAFGASEDPSLHPEMGLWLKYWDHGSNSSGCNANTFITPIIELVAGNGIQIDRGYGNTFISGTSESNGGKGLYLNSTVDNTGNTFIGMDLESNTQGDLVIDGVRNVFINILVKDDTTIGPNAKQNLFQGGRYNNISIAPGASLNKFRDLLYAGTINDQGSDTERFSLFSLNLGTREVFNENAAFSSPPWSWKDTIPPAQVPNFGNPWPRSDMLRGVWSFSKSSPLIVSNTPLPSTIQSWRALFIGSWNNDYEGGSIPQNAILTEVTSKSHYLQIGCCMIANFSLNAQRQLQAQVITETAANYIFFAGTILIIPDPISYTTSVFANMKGSITIGSTTSEELGNPPNGTLVYCSDCTSTCAAGGTGAFAKRVNGSWICN